MNIFVADAFPEKHCIIQGEEGQGGGGGQKAWRSGQAWATANVVQRGGEESASESGDPDAERRTGWLGDRPGVAATWGAGSEILLAPPFARHPFSPNCSAFHRQQNPNLCGLALPPLTLLPFPVPGPGPLHSSTAATPRFPGPAPDPRSLASGGRLPR